MTSSVPDTPSSSRRRRRRRRDRHGRGLRTPLLHPGLPGWRTRSEQFDELVCDIALQLQALWPGAERLEFAVEEVPPSDPAPWEQGIALGRGFAAEARSGLPGRIVLYRRPILEAASQPGADLAIIIRQVLSEQLAHMFEARRS